MSSYFCCIDLQHWWTARTCRCRLIGRRCFYSRAFWIITPTSRSMCLSDGTTGLWAAGGLRTRFIWMCVSTVLENVKLALLFSYKLSWRFAECFDHFVFPASFSRLTESRWCFYFTRQVWIMSCVCGNLLICTWRGYFEGLCRLFSFLSRVFTISLTAWLVIYFKKMKTWCW